MKNKGGALLYKLKQKSTLALSMSNVISKWVMILQMLNRGMTTFLKVCNLHFCS